MLEFWQCSRQVSFNVRGLCGYVGFIVALVPGFDIDDAAIEQANDTASRHGLVNARYSCHNLDVHPEEVCKSLSVKNGDVVIVDPPRAGLHAKAINMLAKVRPS
jgi:tRNA/tmRNA/rRNA uracil-C5-methylase (TrmA/RlmC/RlmD family)